MRVMAIVKASPESERGDLPSQELLEAMTRFNEEMVRAGILLAAEGLRPSSQGKRVHFSGDKTTVIDGPFSETKELIAGFWLLEVKSVEEAVAWMRRCPNPTGEEGVIEVRPVAELEDFGEAYTPEIREAEDRMRAEIARQH